MRQPLSALTAIGGFSVAVAALSVSATASIVLLMPDPPAVQVTVAEAAAALRGRPTTLDRREGAPPEGQSTWLLRSALARELRRPESAVRVVWLDAAANRRTRVFSFPPRPGSSPAATVVLGRERTIAARERLIPSTIRSTAGALPEGFILRMSPGSLRTLPAPASFSPVFQRLILDLPQPAFAAGVRTADGGWVTVSPRRPFFGGWRLKVLAALAVSLLLLAPLAWVFARRLTRPFRVLAATIESGAEPPQLDGPRELREAAGAIVQLRTRLAAEAEERMRMLTAVAHDLRTPLTSLKLRIEGVPEPQRTRMAADADRMGAMIHDVLAFARVADAPRVAVSVRALGAQVVADMNGAGGTVTLAPGADAWVHVVEEGFRRALENLVRNAIDHAGGGRISVEEEAGTVSVTVGDTGPGIAAADRARLIRPFERGDASRNRETGGAGLGLSIVQSFADLHAGTLTLADAPGGGTAAVLRLPAAGRP